MAMNRLAADHRRVLAGLRLRRFAAAATLWSAATAHAADATLDVALWSKYVFRGQVYTDDPVLQPSLTLAGPSGLSFNTWLNFDLTDANSTPDRDTRGRPTEADVTLSWTPAEGVWTPEVGVTAYLISEPPGAAGTTADAWAGLRFDPAELVEGAAAVLPAVSARVWYEFLDIDDLYAALGADRVWELAEGLTLSLSASVGYGRRPYNEYFFGGDDPEAPVVDRGGWNDVTVVAELAWTIGEGVTAGLMGQYTALLDDMIRAAARSRYGGDEWWLGGARVSWEF